MSNTRLFSEIKATGIPMVQMNCHHEEGHVQKIRVDDYKAGIFAGEHADLGHR